METEQNLSVEEDLQLGSAITRQSKDDNTLYLTIPFPSPELATLGYDILSIDRELKGSGIKKQIAVSEDNLKIIFSGPELKKLRVALNAFLKNVILVFKTIEQFQKNSSIQNA